VSQVRLFRNGQQIFAGKELPVDANNPMDMKRIPAGGALRLGIELTPGEYVFQIVVVDTLATKKRSVATQWIDFEIVR
jgi:hypothetical protein